MCACVCVCVSLFAFTVSVCVLVLPPTPSYRCAHVDVRVCTHVYVWGCDGVWQIGAIMRCPVTKFITHTTSHMCFLVLLAAATFRITESGVTITDTSELTDSRYKSLTKDEKIQSLLKETLRPASTLITHVQICIVFWILGEMLLLLPPMVLLRPPSLLLLLLLLLLTLLLLLMAMLLTMMMMLIVVLVMMELVILLVVTMMFAVDVT